MSVILCGHSHQSERENRLRQQYQIWRIDELMGFPEQLSELMVVIKFP